MGNRLPRFAAAALIALATPGAVTALYSPAAHAQQPAFAAPVVEMLPIGSVEGDGLTPVTVHFLALGADGMPMTSLGLKATAAAGKVGEVTEVSPGLYKATWTPPKVDATRSYDLSIKGKTADKTAVTGRWGVSVRPPLSHQVSVSANPAEMVLGQDATATLNITLAGGASQPLEGVDLVVLASSGTVTNVTHLGGGSFTALYTPPTDKRYPHLALLTVADRRDPTRSYGAIAIPLVGKADFTVSGMPNSRIVVKTSGREFGPFTADASGKAKAPLIVYPGADIATVVSVAGDQKSESPLDLKVPNARRVQIFPMNQAVPADASAAVPVRAYVTTAQGAPDPSAQVSFTATAGTVTPARHEGGGVYGATFTPPTGTVGSQVSVQVSVADPKFTQADSRDLTLVAARPASVQLTADPPTLGADRKGFQVFAKVNGPDGAGMPRRSLSFVSDGASLQSIRDAGNGSYQASFATTGSGPVELVATVTATASGNPLRQVIALPARDHLPNDGLSSSMITVITLDEFGYPVAGVPVKLRVATGEGSLPPQATTNDAGIAQVHYTAGRTAGLVQLEVTAGDYTTATAILAAPMTVMPGFSLPASGSESTLARTTAWKNIVASLRLERESAVAPIAAAAAAPEAAATPAATPAAAPAGAPAPATTPTTAAVPTQLQVMATPAQATPGSPLTLDMQLSDATGSGLGGQALEFLTSAGSVSDVEDLGAGRYRTTLSVPATAAGEIKVSVATSNGAVSSFVRIPVEESTESVWGATTAAVADAPPAAATPAPAAAPAPAVAPAAVATTDPGTQKVKKVKEPRPESDRPWLRAGAGYLGGFYSYEQAPQSSRGPLYKGNIAFGSLSATEGSSPAPTAGLAVEGRAFLPSVQWLGAEVGLRASYYSVSLPSASAPIPDWVTTIRALAIPRYAFDVGGSQLHIGARVGLDLADLMVYQEGETGDSSSLSYSGLLVPSLAIGAEIGAEIGERMFGHAALTTGMSDQLPKPYAVGVDAAFGYGILDNLYASVGFGYLSRGTSVWVVPDNSSLDKAEVGVVSDRTTQFTLGLGYQL